VAARRGRLAAARKKKQLGGGLASRRQHCGVTSAESHHGDGWRLHIGRHLYQINGGMAGEEQAWKSGK